MATVLRITALLAGFRRAGIAHPAEPVDHPIDSFTAEQRKTLDYEPQLVVEEVDLGPSSTEKDAADKAAAEQAAKEAADKAGAEQAAAEQAEKAAAEKARADRLAAEKAEKAAAAKAKKAAAKKAASDAEKPASDK